MPGMRIIDESGDGFSWTSAGHSWLARTSHALRANGDVWIVDPVDFPALDERVRALGSPRAVLKLFVQHGRDGSTVASRLGVPLLELPRSLPGSPFELVPVPGPAGWSEAALWWQERETLVVPEAVGSAHHYCASGRPLGVHPVLRLLWPPKVLGRFEPRHLLVGHGPGLHEAVPEQLRSAIERSRRDVLRVLPNIVAARFHHAGV
jgi:hypothetical protein